MIRKNLVIYSLALSGSLIPFCSVTASTTFPLFFEQMCYGASLTGLAGNSSLGYADILLPITNQPTQFLYIDPQVLYHDNDTYTGSLGIGYRQLQSHQPGIWGGYLFADYNHSPNNNNFWFINPGVERLGTSVDLSANIYIPISNQKTDLGTVFGQDIQQYQYIVFQGHTEYDQTFISYESTGFGADAELAYRIPVFTQPKISLGGYYANPKDASQITGGTVRLEIPLTDRLSVSMSEAYDNFAHNTVKFGASYAFGRRHTSKHFNGDLTERMLDPIHRNLIAVSGNATTAEPIVQTYNATGNLAVVMDHISFVVPSPSNSNPDTLEGNGTYENPYIGFSQDTVDAGNAANNHNFFINSGTYFPITAINLENDALYGRENYQGRLFVKPAEGNNRPLMHFDSSGFIVSGDNNILDSLRLTNGFTFEGSAVSLKNTGSSRQILWLNNMDIQHFGNGVRIENDSNGEVDVFIKRSHIDNSVTSGVLLLNDVLGTAKLDLQETRIDNNTFGVSIQNSGALSLIAKHSYFQNNESSGLALTNTGEGVVTMNFEDSYFSNNMTGLTAFNFGAGILNITVKNSYFNDNGGNGLYVENNDIGRLTLKVMDSFIEHNNRTAITRTGGLYALNNASTPLSISVDSTEFNYNLIGMFTENHGPGVLDVTVNDILFNHNEVGLYVQGAGSGVLNLNVNSSTFTHSTTGLFGENLSSGALNIHINNAIFDRNFTGALVANDSTGTTRVNAINTQFSQNTFGILGFNTLGNQNAMSITLTNPTFLNNVLDTNEAATQNIIDWTID